MIYSKEILTAADDPEALEQAYQDARRAKEEAAFRDALEACYRDAPENVLYAAWHYRLAQAARLVQAARDAQPAVNWVLAVPLSVALGLFFGLLFDERLELPDGLPYLILGWAPIATCFVLVFLALTSRQQVKRAVLAGVSLLALLLYVTLFVAFRDRAHYILLMILHLPLMAWIGSGLYVLGPRSEPRERFAFLVQSIEVFVTAGLFVGAGGAFGLITVGMFQTLGISLPVAGVQRLFAAGGGLIPVLAVASGYDPRSHPVGSSLRQGLSKIISTLMRLMLPMTLLVLMVYLVVIPFNFMEPFHDRNTLIVYNVMLFGVMGLLVGATPVHETDLSEKSHRVLRMGVLAVAVLAVLVSLYALSATVYRTVTLGGWTVNRLAVIGWNTINVGLLVLLVIKQLQAGADRWLDAAQTVFGWGMRAYAVWAGFLVLFIPLLFGER